MGPVPLFWKVLSHYTFHDNWEATGKDKMEIIAFLAAQGADLGWRNAAGEDIQQWTKANIAQFQPFWGWTVEEQEAKFPHEFFDWLEQLRTQPELAKQYLEEREKERQASEGGGGEGEKT